MEAFDKLFTDTSDYIATLELTYLRKYLADTTTTPTDYDLDVKSYCVLCHAAFEEFAETIAVQLMDSSIEKYKLHKTVSETIVTLMHFKSDGKSYLDKAEDDDKIEIISTYDYIRTRLEDAKDKFSREIFNNHGVSLKYMKQLLMPVAIDITTDPSLQSSLTNLAKERGAYAHKLREKGTLRKSVSPEDAKTFVSDCIKICDDLRTKANARI